MKNMKKIAAVLVVLLMMLGLFAGCGSAAGHITLNGQRVGIDYAMKINGRKVSMAEYRFYFLNLKTNMFDQGDDTYWDTNPSAQDSLLSYTENYLKSQYASQIMAEDNGLKLDATDYASIEEQKAAAIQSADSQEAFEQALAQQYMTEDLYEVLMQQSMLQQKLNDFLFGENGTMAIPESEEDSILRDNYVHVVHILVNDEETAQTVLDRINAGEDITDLMSEYNQDTGETADGYTFTKGEMVESFENAAFALEVGQISGIVQSDYGYHVIKRLDISDDYLAENRDDMLDTYKSQLLYDELDKVSATLEVEYNKFYDQFGVDTILDDGFDSVSGSTNPFMMFIQTLTLGVIIGTIIVAALVGILMLVSLWFIFKKAGEKPWACVVPFYQIYCLFRMTWGNGWYFLLALIPGVNIVINIITMYKLSKVFGHDIGWFFGLWLLPVVFYPMLAFGSSSYAGIHPQMPLATEDTSDYQEDEILGDVSEDDIDDYGTYDPDESVIEKDELLNDKDENEEEDDSEITDLEDK